MAESSPHALDASGHKTAGADDLRDHFMSLHAEEGIGAIPLRSLSRHVPLLLAPDCSIRNALIALNSAASDAGLVAPEPAAPLGIVTVRHLVDAITLHNGTLDDPVIAFMTGAPPSLPADAPVHRARVLLTRSRCSHLLLLENDGQCSRLISQAEIPGFREGGGDVLAKTIGTAGDIASLAVAAGEIRRRGAELFAAGMGVETLCQWMSGLNDLLSLRLIELVADAFDLPPVPWCWLVFGSEGRLEQTFTTDQDNGLIFLSDEAAEEEDVRLAFLPFAQEVNRALDRCGFALCRGNIMAGNRRWCLSLREWRERFSQWMELPEPEAILNATIFFDFRPLYGQDELADQLRGWLLPQPARLPRFLHCLGEQALTCAPASGFLGRFVYDGGRQHPHTIDLKLHGIRPFVDVARVWALRHQAWDTGTADRLRAVGPAMHRSGGDTAAAVEAFNLVQRIRMQQQLLRGDPEQANRIDPRQLNDLQRVSLREAFGRAKLLQTSLRQEISTAG